jgi:hypothetical protein
MATLFLLLGAALVAVVAYAALVRSKARSALADLIHETKTTKVDKLRPGLAELEGKIASVSGQLLRAPVSGKACVMYRFLVEEQVSSGSGKHRKTRWVSRIDEKRQVGFVLHDGTGGVEVDFTKGELFLGSDQGGRSGFLNDATPEFDRALRERGQSSTGMVMNRTLRWSEMYLEVGDPLYALGTYDGRRVTKGSDGILVVSDQGQTTVLQRIAGEASMLRRVAIGGFVVAGAMGLFSFVPLFLRH